MEHTSIEHMKRLRRFVNMPNLPCMPNTVEEFEPVVEILNMQLECIHARLEAVKKWKLVYSQEVDTATTKGVALCEFDLNMKRWFQTFKPHDCAVNDFKSDAGLMLFQHDNDAVESAQYAIDSLKALQRKRKRDGDSLLVCPIPIKPRSSQNLGMGQSLYSQSTGFSSACCTPPLTTKKTEDCEERTVKKGLSPEERARVILLNSCV